MKANDERKAAKRKAVKRQPVSEIKSEPGWNRKETGWPVRQVGIERNGFTNG